ncbi:MAG: hypothetical protein K0U98_04350 [Deltaproteobacteria bacterium]|nr:hypothetical protein [Deltaproteobacteria bacterium]
MLGDGEAERFLGASLLGIGDDEVVHSILEIMYADAPQTLFQRAVRIYPTVSELIPTMLQGLGPVRNQLSNSYQASNREFIRYISDSLSFS